MTARKTASKTSETVALEEAPAPSESPERNGAVESKDTWKMPRPCRGQSVIFYYRSTVSERNADVAFVSSVGESSISVIYRGNGYDEVFHIDDPRLKANPDLRMDIHGVWEFTKESKELEERIAAIERRLEELS